MKIGLMFASSTYTTAEECAHAVAIAEDVGIESIWAVEHVLTPLHLRSAYPYTEDGQVAGITDGVFCDPIVWLSFVAGISRTLRLGTGIMILPQRHPAYVAKEWATLDRLPFRDAKGWIEYAKANPGKLTYATQGIGGGQHLNMERTMEALGIQMTHVPYGNTQMMPDVLTGAINLTAFGVITLKPHIDAGKLIPIATSGPRRSPQLPNVPALKEMGYDIAAQSWTAIIGPPGTPSEIVAKLNAAFNAAQKTPELAKILAGDESNVSYASPQATTAQIKAEYDRMGPIVRRLNLKFD